MAKILFEIRQESPRILIFGANFRFRYLKRKDKCLNDAVHFLGFFFSPIIKKN